MVKYKKEKILSALKEEALQKLYLGEIVDCFHNALNIKLLFYFKFGKIYSGAQK